MFSGGIALASSRFRGPGLSKGRNHSEVFSYEKNSNPWKKMNVIFVLEKTWKKNGELVTDLSSRSMIYPVVAHLFFFAATKTNRDICCQALSAFVHCLLDFIAMNDSALAIAAVPGTTLPLRVMEPVELLSPKQKLGRGKTIWMSKHDITWLFLMVHVCSLLSRLV